MNTTMTILGIVLIVAILVLVSIWVGEMINDDRK